ncbi:hypothetical protein OGATHE_001590 [Ogataea polymorpha]|uniref:Uncharacterized protein n=1 Tax=Ogataea polymorpha TaxID=460523 RepID=A0A9P8PPE2_9ASCO|nr:hypothetical protein OGATHE_001590 [Ogataea polymorpha]
MESEVVATYYQDQTADGVECQRHQESVSIEGVCEVNRRERVGESKLKKTEVLHQNDEQGNGVEVGHGDDFLERQEDRQQKQEYRNVVEICLTD